MAVATQNRITALEGTNGKASRAEKLAQSRADKVSIPAPDIRMMNVDIEGDSPLICNQFSKKSQREMEDKQQGKAKQKRAPKNPEECFEGSLYPLPGKKGKYGFPASAFKKSAVSACRFVEGVPMTIAKGAFFVMGDLIEIVGPKPTMRTDTVRVGKFGSKTADIRYRGEFAKWGCTLTIRYNARAITPEQIVNLINTAGFSIGVGEWRAEKDGAAGMYHVKRQH